MLSLDCCPTKNYCCRLEPGQHTTLLSSRHHNPTTTQTPKSPAFHTLLHTRILDRIFTLKIRPHPHRTLQDIAAQYGSVAPTSLRPSTKDSQSFLSELNEPLTVAPSLHRPHNPTHPPCDHKQSRGWTQPRCVACPHHKHNIKVTDIFQQR
jgi:hypothetical protein